METKELQSEINKTFSELGEIISSFDEDQFNLIPFEGSWTAGQVTQHVTLSISGFEKIMNGSIAETERSPDALKQKIKEIFLDFTTKIKSPDFIAVSYTHLTLPTNREV